MANKDPSVREFADGPGVKPVPLYRYVGTHRELREHRAAVLWEETK